MAFIKEITPQEFLLRFNAKGEVQGAHYVAKTDIYEDDQLISSSVNPPTAVTLGIENGLPLKQVLKDLNVFTLTSLESEKLKSSNLYLLLNEEKLKVSGLDLQLSDSNSEIENLKNKLQESNAKLVEANKTVEKLISEIPVKENAPE